MAANDLMQSFLDNYGLQLAVTASILVVYLLVVRFTKPKIVEGADQGRFKDSAATNAINLVRLFYSIFAVLILAVVWGLDFRSVIIFTTTTVTLLGVALFASWSILSNITAYFVLLLHPSYRRGTFIRVIDVDNYAEGYISDLSPFNTKLVTENREVILYPNNLLLGRPAMINPRDRLDGIGKLKPSIQPDPDPA